MIPRKPVPESIRDGDRFPACAKPMDGTIFSVDTSGGEGKSDEIMR